MRWAQDLSKIGQSLRYVAEVHVQTDHTLVCSARLRNLSELFVCTCQGVINPESISFIIDLQLHCETEYVHGHAVLLLERIAGAELFADLEAVTAALHGDLELCDRFVDQT